MKIKIVQNLVLVILFVATGAHASESLRVEGKKATNLLNALKANGAVGEVRVDLTTWQVSKVACEYTPDGYIYAQCSLTDDHQKKSLNSFTGVALDLYNALAKAGAVQSFELPSRFINVRRVVCVLETGGLKEFPNCEIFQD